MGRKTYESLPNGALPHRRNIVVSRSRKELPNCEVYASLEEALAAVTNEPEKEKAERNNTVIDKECFIIGGESIYSHATIVDEEPEAADTFFPAINPKEWEVAEKEMRNENDLSFTFLTLYRKQ